MDKSEVKYDKIMDKLKFKGYSRIEDPILELKPEIEELKAAVNVTKTKYIVPGKGSIRSHDVTNWMNTTPKNGKLYK